MLVVKNIHLEEVHQWRRNGDHPNDYANPFDGFENGEPKTFTPEECQANEWEGQVVRYFRHPDIDGQTVCDICGHTFHEHGWLDHPDKGSKVCPGDYIEGSNGDYIVLKQSIVNEYYTVVQDRESGLFRKDFQDRVRHWLKFAFEERFPHIIDCKRERNHRFLEESLELVQACGLPEIEAIELVKYVYSRPVGEIFQEAGGVSTTFSALCHTHGINVNHAAETELERDYRVVDKIRTRQALKLSMLVTSDSASNDAVDVTVIFEIPDPLSR